MRLRDVQSLNDINHRPLHGCRWVAVGVFLLPRPTRCQLPRSSGIGNSDSVAPLHDGLHCTGAEGRSQSRDRHVDGVL